MVSASRKDKSVSRNKSIYGQLTFDKGNSVAKGKSSPQKVEEQLDNHKKRKEHGSVSHRIYKITVCTMHLKVKPKTIKIKKKT